ncbi:alpha-1-antiproteinase-like [Meriones unguiculatus]|uniref:alpha-1-antiproteinase-like n=1 Tax=Meriones unguiculatus TaxID=10047 RepID=UPI00293E984F|nr:alpha-1-antiproteinase-like [Meriones unguiculatus]
MPSSVSQGFLLLAGLCCLFSGSQPQDPLEIDVEQHGHEHQELLSCQCIAYSIIQLTFTLYRKSGSWAKDTNILFSPVNIVAASFMLLLGAKPNMHSQILEGLDFNLTETPEQYIHECFQQLTYILYLPDHKSQLTMQSSLSTAQSLKLTDKFVKNVKGLYYSTAIAVNFSDMQRAQNQINEYVQGETQGKIVALIKDLKTDTAFALMNYILFQGKLYDELFEAEYILEEDFHVNEDVTMKVPMINCQVRFIGSQGANNSEMSLSPLQIKTVDLHFPKLLMSKTYDLKTILSTLGITQIFSNEANLSGVTEDAPLKLIKDQEVKNFTVAITAVYWGLSSMTHGPMAPFCGYLRTMTPYFSCSFFLIAGLSCLLPGFQTEGYQDTQASDHKKKKQEPPQCKTFAPIITNISLFLLQNAVHQPKNPTLHSPE